MSGFGSLPSRDRLLYDADGEWRRAERRRSTRAMWLGLPLGIALAAFLREILRSLGV